eukprot:748854-Prymnesium_polylepis.1
MRAKRDESEGALAAYPCDRPRAAATDRVACGLQPLVSMVGQGALRAARVVIHGAVQKHTARSDAKCGACWQSRSVPLRRRTSCASP